MTRKFFFHSFQHDLAGTDLYEYIHLDDHEEMSRILSLSPEETAELRSLVSSQQSHPIAYGQDINVEFQRSFFLRMKCVLAKRNAGITSQGHKVSFWLTFDADCDLSFCTDSRNLPGNSL